MQPFKSLVFPAAILGVSLVSSCALVSEPSNSQTLSEFSDKDLHNKTFLVEDISGKGIVDYSNITLYFHENGQFSANTGCNSVFGEYSRNGDSLEFGALGATKKMCAPALMEQEQAVISALSATNGIVQRSDGALILTSNNGQEMRGFEAVQPALYSYRCTDGTELSVTYPTHKMAVLTLGGQDYELQISQSASGARYMNDEFEWWGKGEDEGMLSTVVNGKVDRSLKPNLCTIK